VFAKHDLHIRQAQANFADYQDKSVLLLSMSNLRSMRVFTPDTFAGHRLEAIGLSVLLPSGSALDPSGLMNSVEMLPELKPDDVTVMASGDSQMKEIKTQWNEHPVLRSHPASQANQVKSTSWIINNGVVSIAHLSPSWFLTNYSISHYPAMTRSRMIANMRGWLTPKLYPCSDGLTRPPNEADFCSSG
jgi:ABC-type Fe3+-citrate transport system substrate-binding protein